MSEPDPKDRLAALEARLAEKRGADPEQRSTQAEYHSQAEIAWRMVTELVAGLLVGFGMGYGLDLLLGTQPWLMVVFTLLGLAAGMLSVVRTAKAMQKKQMDADKARRDAERLNDGD